MVVARVFTLLLQDGILQGLRVVTHDRTGTREDALADDGVCTEVRDNLVDTSSPLELGIELPKGHLEGDMAPCRVFWVLIAIPVTDEIVFREFVDGFRHQTIGSKDVVKERFDGFLLVLFLSCLFRLFLPAWLQEFVDGDLVAVGKFL